MKKGLLVLLAMGCLCLLVQPVAAGERAGAFSVSPFAGGYTFDGTQHLETAPVYGIRFGYDFTKHWGLEASADYLATKRTKDERSYNSAGYYLDLLYNFMPDGALVPYVAAGGGATTIGHGSNFDNSPPSTSPVNELGYHKHTNTAATANVGLGLKYFVTDSVALRADVRQLFIFAQQTVYNWEYTAGLTFLFGGNKPAPAPAPAAVEEPKAAPAPPPPPTSSLNVTPASVKKGETATLNWTSQNATDCDIEPGIGKVGAQGSKTITPDANTSYTMSCNGPGGTANSAAQVSVAAPPPPPAAPTATLAVVPASVTKGETAKLNWSSQNATNCDIQPGIGAVQTQGTMDVTPAADTDYTITCNGAGGTANGATKVSVVVPPPPAPTPEQRCVTLHINFATGKADIPHQYHADLQKVADFMKSYPEVKGVIEGHTDNRGTKAMNEKLSEKRAQSVKNYLVKEFGIDPARLGVKGYGFAKPVASNKTEAGRRENRRIMANFDCVQK